MLPAGTLGLFFVAIYARLTRSAMLDVAGEDFIRTARAKASGRPHGAAPYPAQRVVAGRVVRRLQAGYLVGGSVLIETVFAWPGIGRLAFDALLARDYQVLLGVFLTTAILVVLFNLATDLIYLAIDPRMQAS